jgi:hypothetical protein
MNQYRPIVLLLALTVAATAEDKAFVGVRFGDEARIEHVFPGSPAEEAGLAVGDLVKKFGDEEITSTEQLQELIQARKPQEKGVFSVDREGEKKELTVTFGRRSVKWFLQQQDPPRVPGGTIQLSGGGIGGDFEQSGNFIVEGPCRMEGNFTQHWTGVLDLLFASGEPPLTVGGELKLGGMLHVRLADDVKPKLGERYKIIAGAKSIDGKFDELSLPKLGDKLGWRVEYDNIERMDDFDRNGLHDVTIVVVDPEKEMPPVEP